MGDAQTANTEPPSSSTSTSDLAVGHDGFVVVWQSDQTPGDDDSGTSIQGRLYAADDTPVTDQFQVNGFTSGDQDQPGVSMGPDGGFVVAWNNDGASDVRGARFAADGTPLGEFVVSSITSTSSAARVGPGHDASGGFAVAWEGFPSAGDDTSIRSVQARYFDRDGCPTVLSSRSTPIRRTGKTSRSWR
jgi:hypothetical protein